MSDSIEKPPLQSQVDQLTERLDFIAPRLSLLTQSLDYFQKVESEASVQLSRLKFADEASQACSAVIGESQSLNMAIWFQSVTDCILGQLEVKAKIQTQFHEQSKMQSRVQEQAELLAEMQQTQAQAQMQAEALQEMQAQSQTASKEQAQALKDLQAQVLTMRHEAQVTALQNQVQKPSAVAQGASLPIQRSHSPGPTPGPSSPHFGQDAAVRREWRSSDENKHVESVFPDRQGLQRQSSLHTPFPVEEHQSRVTTTKPQTLVPSRMDSSPAYPATPPSASSYPSMAPSMETTLERHGMALGKGTWANAYRQASGARRSALRMLCVSGIITERELADDLTIISEEHIEECIAIAIEMLKRWPPERGSPPLHEGKRFFEEQLAALYMSKAPAGGVFIPNEHR